MIPTYNEEANIENLYNAIKEEFKNNLSNYNYDIIFIDNKSKETKIIVVLFLLIFWLIMPKRIELITLPALFAVPKEPNFVSFIFNWAFISFVADENIPLETFSIYRFN